MTDSPPDPKRETGPSPEMRRWIERRAAVRAAAAADRLRQAAEGREPVERDGSNLWLVGAGFAVVLVLVLAAWFIVGRMRCDPFYSDTALAKASGCR